MKKYDPNTEMHSFNGKHGKTLILGVGTHLGITFLDDTTVTDSFTLEQMMELTDWLTSQIERKREDGTIR